VDSVFGLFELSVFSETNRMASKEASIIIIFEYVDIPCCLTLSRFSVHV